MRRITDLAYFTGLFLLSLVPPRDYDMWFHIKSGEIILKYGLIRHDVFSFVTAGREWFPHEWLFQVAIYLYTNPLGIPALTWAVSLTAVLTIVSFLIYLRRIAGIPAVLSYIAGLGLFAGMYDYLSPRPQLFQYLFSVLLLIILHSYLLKKKDYLVLLLPLTYLWAQIHASVFTAMILIFSTAVLTALSGVITRNAGRTRQGMILAGYGLAAGLLSIAPPIGLTQYRLSLYILRHQPIMSSFVDEWQPLITGLYEFTTYTLFFGIAVAGFIFCLVKRKRRFWMILMIPLLVLIATAYPASRNTVMGYAYTGIILGFVYSSLKQSVSRASVTVICAILTVVFLVNGTQKKYFPEISYPANYPAGAVTFLLTHHFNGNLFNHYDYGGYLLYALYPDYKIFIDGRTDLYLCCEIPRLHALYTYMGDDDDIYAVEQYRYILNPYHISIALVPSEQSYGFMKMRRIFDSDPDWVKVFADATSVIYIRRDGKNDAQLTALGFR